jgi:phosphatidylserine synthase
MWKEARRRYPKPIEDTRTPSDIGLGFYFFSPLKMMMNIGIPELYEFEFRKSKICLHSIVMPALQAVAGVVEPPGCLKIIPIILESFTLHP